MSVFAALATMTAVQQVSAASNMSVKKPRVSQSSIQHSLYFEKNVGQANNSISALSHGDGYTVFLSPNSAALRHNSRGHTATGVRMFLAGANPNAALFTAEPSSAHVNYLIGRDSHRWIHNLALAKQIGFRGVYPGIDVVYYGRGRNLEYDYNVAPGAKPQSINLKVVGSGTISMANGDLRYMSKQNNLLWQQPVAYQIIGGHKCAVPAKYVLNRNGSVGFGLGKYNHSYSLVIDPVVVFSTYIGGSGIDNGQGAGVDSVGNGYVAGSTTSVNFPKTEGPILSGNEDGFVAKYSPAGRLVWATYFGGTGADTATGLSVDPASGECYVVGNTKSIDFPAPGGFQTANGGGQDGYLVKLSADGSTIKYGTYLGGTGADTATSVSNVVNGAVVVGGGTASSDFPTSGNLQPFVQGSDGFVCLVNTAVTGANSLVDSTFIGGSSNSQVNGVAIGSDNGIYMCGTAGASLNVTPGAMQTTFGGGSSDGFVAKIKPDFSGFNYETYLGGSLADAANAIAVDSTGQAYVTGATTSSNFPVRTGGYLTVFPAGSVSNEAFYTKLSADGKTIQASTLFGGGDVAGPPTQSGGAQGNGIALDGLGNVFITGSAGANMQFATAIQAVPLQNAFGGASDDGFLAEFSPDGTTLDYSTYLGGSSADSATGIAVNGNVGYVVGATSSANFPTSGAFIQQPIFGGGSDGFVVKFGISGNQPEVYADVSQAVYAGSIGQILPIHGINFLPGGTVRFPDGITVPYQYINSTSVTIVIPDSEDANPGILNCLFINPGIDEGTAPFTIDVISNPVPAVINITPTSVYAGSPAFPLFIVGSNFENLTAVSISYGSPAVVVNLTPTVTDTGHITVTMPAAAVAKEGNVTITVSNPAPGGGSATATFVVNRVPLPVITSMTPNPVLVGSIGVNLTIVGSGFVPGLTTVLLNNVQYPATVQPAKIIVAVPDFLVQNVGSVAVEVVNPSPDSPTDVDGGTAQQTLIVYVNAAPTITSLSPNPVIAGQDGELLTINGTGFNPNSTVSFDGSSPVVPTSYTGTQIIVALPSSAVSSARTVTVTVTNPAPGGGAASAPLSVVYGTPTATSLTPSTITQGALGASVTITGSGFTQASLVKFNNVFATNVSYNSGTQLTVVVPSAVVNVVGAVSVVVYNPTPSTGSAPLTLTITPAGLSSISVSPTTALGGANIVGTVTLKATAPTGGVVVTLSSDSPAVAPVPATITVSSGQTSATFSIPTRTVTTQTVATISATLGATPVTAALTLNPYPGNNFGKGLRFFSLPFDYPTDPLDGLFGYTGVKLASWNAVIEQYAVTPTAPADHIRLGQGYWGRFPGAVSVSHIGTPADTTTDFVIALAAGWNQIGVPFLTGNNLQDIRFSNGALTYADATGPVYNLIQANVYEYDAPIDGTTGSYAVVGANQQLQPGSAYWIKAYAATNMTFPHPVAVPSAKHGR